MTFYSFWLYALEMAVFVCFMSKNTSDTSGVKLEIPTCTKDLYSPTFLMRTRAQSVQYHPNVKKNTIYFL